MLLVVYGLCEVTCQTEMSISFTMILGITLLVIYLYENVNPSLSIFATNMCHLVKISV